MTTYTKICGIRSHAAARKAVANGVNALGFVFYEPSPRNIDVDAAADIIQALPPFVAATGLFVNADTAEVKRISAACRLDLLQFHGDESPEYCSQFDRPYIKAIRVKSATCVSDAAKNYVSAKGLLLDTYVAGIPGGTGEIFDWAMVPDNISMPLIIAGGLNADNVGDLIGRFKPFAVDVSGGVESAKGIKDLEKISAFLNAVKLASSDKTRIS